MGGNLIGFILFVGLGVAVIGGLPSTLVGCLTGYSIGHRLAQYPQRLALERAVLLGCGISLAGIAVTHLIIGPFIFDSNREIYLGLLGIPSVIYLIVGGWGAATLNQRTIDQVERMGGKRGGEVENLSVTNEVKPARLWATIHVSPLDT